MKHRADGLESGLQASWSLCERVRADLLATLGPVPPVHWANRPGGDRSSLTPPVSAKLYDSSLDAYPFPPGAAPPALQPEGLDAGEARKRLAAAHARFFEELKRFAAGDPDAIAAPDPASDLWFTLGGWVRVQALHEEHHILQIKELAREW